LLKKARAGLESVGQRDPVGSQVPDVLLSAITSRATSARETTKLIIDDLAAAQEC
jgi:hypothetical protein